MTKQYDAHVKARWRHQARPTLTRVDQAIAAAIEISELVYKAIGMTVLSSVIEYAASSTHSSRLDELTFAMTAVLQIYATVVPLRIARVIQQMFEVVVVIPIQVIIIAICGALGWIVAGIGSDGFLAIEALVRAAHPAH